MTKETIYTTVEMTDGNIVDFPAKRKMQKTLTVDEDGFIVPMRSAEAIAEKNRNMKGLMDAEGLPFNDRSHTYNSRLAQEIGTWAETQEGGNAIHDKFFEAYFVDGRDIGDIDVILDVVKSVGLDETQARAVLEDRSFKEAVDADWAKSHSYGVTGVPTFVCNRQGLVGAQPYEVLEQLMTEAGAEPR